MKHLLISAAAAIALAACTSSPKGWTIDGTVDGGPGRKMAIEGFNAGRWYTVDSVEIGPDGRFAYAAQAPAAVAEVLRISLDGRSIYFPVDSLDALHLTTDTAAFGTAYELTGTPAAEKIVEIDRLIAASVAAGGNEGALRDSVLKARLNDIAINDSTCIAAYYIVNKTIGGRALYDLSKRLDLGVVGAVAQRFSDMRPDDARTEWLKAIFLRARQLSNPTAGISLEAQESGLIDISRFDNRGVGRALSAVAGKGHPVLLSFTSYEMEASPAYNVVLADLQRANPGLEIYQIAFDTDEVEWKQKADNLPWITVWNSPMDGADVLMHYNVGALPVTYVIGSDGVIRERVDNPAELAAAVARNR